MEEASKAAFSVGEEALLEETADLEKVLSLVSLAVVNRLEVAEQSNSNLDLGDDDDEELKQSVLSLCSVSD